MAARLVLTGHEPLQLFISSPAPVDDPVRLSIRFIMSRMGVGHGSILGHSRYLSGADIRLVGQRKDHLSSLPLRTLGRVLAGTIKAGRLRECAQKYRPAEPDLDRFDGRDSTKLHWYALSACAARAYRQHLCLSEHRQTRWGKRLLQLLEPLPSLTLPAMCQSLISQLFATLIPSVRCSYFQRHSRLMADLEVFRSCEAPMSDRNSVRAEQLLDVSDAE